MKMYGDIEDSAHLVSGTDITSFDEEIVLPDLQKIEAANAEILAKREAELKAQEEARLEADRQAREQAQSDFLKQQAQEEREVRERMQREEEEELRRLEEEAERKRQANPLNKLSGLFRGKKSETGEEKEEKKKIDKKAKGKKEKSIKENETETEKEDLVEEIPEPVEIEEEEEDPDYEYLATHDELTGLFNNTAYQRQLKKTSEKNMAILFFDVNNLKKANDTLGHSFGNKLILATAQVLKELFQSCAYRIGGDEFVVLLVGANEKKIEKQISIFQKKMDEYTQKDTDGLIYAVSVGYCIGNGKMSKQEIQDAADKAMYAQKEAYKKAHPELNGRPEEKAPPQKKKPEKPKLSHDEMLTKEQQHLKTIIQEGHLLADEERTDRIIAEIQSRSNEIHAILIASPTFDHLFIFRSVPRFINLMLQMDGIVDYSYIYVVYDGGSQYYGVDDYLDQVTRLFEDIAGNIRYNHSLSNRDIQRIKGINIFKNVYFE